MTKRQLAILLSKESRLNLTQRKAVDIVDTIFDIVSLELQDTSGRVAIRDFGTFEIRTRAPYTGRNPKSGLPVDVPSRRVVYFIPSRKLIQRLN